MITGTSTYSANVGLVSIPRPHTTPKASAIGRRVRRSVASNTASARATIAASGKSSWKRSVENTTNGALPNSSAAATPTVPPARARPSRYTAAMPSPRKPTMTAAAAAASDSPSSIPSAAETEHERRIEGRALEDAADVAGAQVARALHRALQVVGVIPLRRRRSTASQTLATSARTRNAAGHDQPLAPRPCRSRPRQAPRCAPDQGDAGRRTPPGGSRRGSCATVHTGWRGAGSSAAAGNQVPVDVARSGCPSSS